ncbi:GTP-binding protein [Archangium gephyra]|uniref:GTP-binding protein n=1 Tax=Archangium gephyra TaxID=48 RepID=UPI003B78F9CF
MELLRFATAGSVDDGKSTLIGRLLYDTKSIFEDQLTSVERTSKARGDEYTNLALLMDGLRAEREQGITIDVAYRYFATPRRKFIIADTPGHLQYTRNMVTGASTADLALILVDARKGLLEQTRRHAFIASLLRVPHVVLCINKMDLVGYDETVFESIKDEFRKFSMKLEAHGSHLHPHLRAQRRQRGDALGDDALVPGPRAAAPPGECAHRLGPQPHPGALPRAVRVPAHLQEAPRLPRLFRAGGGRRAAAGG